MEDLACFARHLQSHAPEIFQRPDHSEPVTGGSSVIVTFTTMTRIRVDFNRREGSGSIAISPNEGEIPEEELKVGAIVTLYEPGDIECEAVLRHGTRWKWVADILDGPIRDAR